ncbi:MAG: HAD-IIIC family phosphatase [Streptosporangiaceae bacterium]|nr:HAD-IIIC family phosphatase [Streptosporangiaceae bacterium]
MPDKPKLVKCLVWDLDNTLWQGTLLESAEVTVFPGLRDVIVELDSRGILQSIASKNDYDLAWRRLEEAGLAEYFVHPQIHWGRKSDSVGEIAEQLNFALDTIAFIDDLPSERAEVAFRASEIRCYAAEQAASLPELPEFSPEVVTIDARRRRQMYQASFRRDAERESFAGPDEEFLRSLDLVMTVQRAGEDDLSRVEELTLRTSQMNATGVHYPDAVLRGLLDDQNHEVLTVTLTDRFGPHGAVGVLLLEYHRAVWHLKLLATSCRVVSFGAGAVILNWLIDQAARAGAHLAADFRPTDRNRMMDIAYRFAGFAEEPCTCTAELGSVSGPGPVSVSGSVSGSGSGSRSEQGPDRDGIKCLHLVADPRQAPTTMRLNSPDLAAGRLDRSGSMR